MWWNCNGFSVLGVFIVKEHWNQFNTLKAFLDDHGYTLVL